VQLNIIIVLTADGDTIELADIENINGVVFV
jgi:hypothetical protein